MDRSARVLAAVLQPIVAAKRAEVARLVPRLAGLASAAADMPAARPFAAALRDPRSVRVIAEFKRRSPSAGWIREGASAAAIGAGYERSGAAAISVLTDGPYFGGSLADLEAVRAATTVPVLRKDFVVAAAQLYESRVAGADAVLLIARILDGGELGELHALAAELGLGVLVEVHDAAELERAVGIGAAVIGVNNRDLDTLRTDRGLALGLASSLPADRVGVAESGIVTPAHVDDVGRAGLHAVLVGESLMRSPDPAMALRALVGRPRVDRAAPAANPAARRTPHTPEGRLLVKICGVCRPADAQLALDAGADCVGVIVDASGPRQQGVDGAQRIFAVVPPLRRVGVFADAPASAVLAAAAELDLAVIQLHGDEAPGDVAHIRAATTAAVWKSVHVADGVALAAAAARYGEVVDALLLDGGAPGSRGGAGIRFDWEAVAAGRPASGGLPIIVAGGLSPDNVAEAVGVLGPAGVDVSSGVEVSVGIKSATRIHAFVAAARSAAAPSQPQQAAGS